MSTTTTITIENRLSELERLGQGVEAFAHRLGLSAPATFDLGLAVDEVVTNIISYAYDDGRVHEIVVRLADASGEIVVEIEDDGRPFDPLTVPAPRLDLPLAARPTGGLGMHLVRKVMDAVEYRRRSDRNLLLLRKKTTEAAGAAARTERATEIAETRTGDVLIVAVAGRLDAANAPALGQRLRAAIDAGHRALVVDARRIDFVGSAGVQVLLGAAKRLAPAGGRIALAGLADALREVFELAGLGSAFAFHRTPSAAVAALASSASHT